MQLFLFKASGSTSERIDEELYKANDRVKKTMNELTDNVNAHIATSIPS
jgi:hypothetical protein